MKKFVPPFSETNSTPSMAVFDDPNKGALANMSSQLRSEPQYNGLKLDDLRAMDEFRGHDKLDLFAIANKQLEENAQIYKKSAFHTEFAKRITSKKQK